MLSLAQKIRRVDDGAARIVRRRRAARTPGASRPACASPARERGQRVEALVGPQRAPAGADHELGPSARTVAGPPGSSVPDTGAGAACRGPLLHREALGERRHVPGAVEGGLSASARAGARTARSTATASALVTAPATDTGPRTEDRRERTKASQSSRLARSLASSAAPCVTLAREGALPQGDGAVIGEGSLMIHRFGVRAIALGAMLALAARGSPAQAQSNNAIPTANGAGFDTHLFRPAMDSKGLFSVNGSDILGANDISFGLVIDYGHNLLRTSGRSAHRALLPGDVPVQLRHRQPGRRRPRPADRSHVRLAAAGQRGQPLPLHGLSGAPTSSPSRGSATSARTPSGASRRSSTASASRSGCRSAQALSDAARERRRRRRLLVLALAHPREALRPEGAAPHRGQRRLPRALGASSTTLPLKDGKYADGNLADLRGRRLLPRPRAARPRRPRRTGRTCSRAAPTAPSSSRTRPSAASSSSSSETRT